MSDSDSRSAPVENTATGPIPWAHWGVALLICAVGVVLVVGGSMLPSEESGQTVSPGVFPIIIGAGALVTGVVNVVQAARATGEIRARAREERDATHWPTAAWLVAALVGYAAALVPLGFWQSGAVFVTVVARILGSRKWIRNAATGLVIALALYFLFDRLLGVSLPPGYVRLAF